MEHLVLERCEALFTASFFETASNVERHLHKHDNGMVTEW